MRNDPMMTRLCETPVVASMLTALLAAALLLSVASPAAAQDLTVKAPPQTAPVVIFSATIHPISGEPIERGYIRFDNGVITEVGDMGSGPPPRVRGANYVNAEGKHVYPGMFGANTIMGLMEVGSVRATRDERETNNISPEVHAAVAVNPDSWLMPVTRSNGVLTAMAIPSGGTVPGRASIIRLEGWTHEDMTVEADAGLVLNWPRMRPIDAWWMSRSAEEQLEETQETLREIDEVFDAAQAYLDARAADESVATDMRYEAMAPAMRGDTPLLIRANEIEQIESAVTWAIGRGMRPVIVGGADAEEAAETLLRHDVPVVITGVHRLPGRRDSAYDRPFTLPARLEARGVRFCIASNGGSFETPHERNLPYHAATAVAYGLSQDRAIEAITLSPAEILDVGDRLGSLEVGKVATLFIADGSPLEITTNVEMAWIDGKLIDLTNKQTELDEKYREKYRQLEVTGEGD
jgi:imidazolonepropionase-like amidohydrolase